MNDVGDYNRTYQCAEEVQCADVAKNQNDTNKPGHRDYHCPGQNLNEDRSYEDRLIHHAFDVTALRLRITAIVPAANNNRARIIIPHSFRVGISSSGSPVITNARSSV